MQYSIRIREQLSQVELDGPGEDGRRQLAIDGQTRNVQLSPSGPHQLRIVEDQLATNVHAFSCPEGTWVWANGRSRLVQNGTTRRRASSGDRDAGPRTVTPAMPAVVTEVLVKVGDQVNKNQALVVVSAMKMEMTLTAPHDGTVQAVNTEQGAKVSPGDVLVEIEAAETASDENE
jgi:biotin carboxyl carrier protein